MTNILSQEIIEDAMNKSIERSGTIEQVSSPKEMELDMPAEGILNQPDPLNTPKVNEASDHFFKTMPKVKALAANMRAGSLGRVFNAIIEHPLGDKYPKFRSKAEHELFIMSMACLAAKHEMISAVVKNMQMQQQLANEAINSAATAVAADNTPSEGTNV